MIVNSDTPIRTSWLRISLGLLFFVSGFTGLLFQLVWLRLAFASFGIVTGVLSVVVAAFMLGLSVGSWVGGKIIGPLTRHGHISAIEFYGVSECLIGVGAFVVPQLFEYGERLLAVLGEANSFYYLVGSAVVLGISLLPWCFFMGTTFPFMMAFLQQIDRTETDSFSFLYSCNVLGAMVGTVVTAFVLIETLGFHQTLLIAGIANFVIAATSMVIGWRARKSISSKEVWSSATGRASRRLSVMDQAILFTTGFTSLAMEVVWTRAYMPVLGTQVYAFAFLLFIYLLATRVGSEQYRNHLLRGSKYPVSQLLALLSVAAFLPIVLNDPQITTYALGLPKELLVILVMLGIFPFCALLGYLTPYLIDANAEGNAPEAGRAYAVNIVGCIMGSLTASYLLLPQLGAKNSMIALAMPFLILFALNCVPLKRVWRWTVASVSFLFLTTSVFYHLSYEDPRGNNSASYIVRRDHTATVTSMGQGIDKRLLVNGIGITYLTPITKFMAHLPLGFLTGKPKSGLVICFGMGTMYRSLMSWDIHVTGVELVPSVKDAFTYYFDDARELLQNPNGRIVIDDGRRFLKRTQKKFDVITIDAPPPVEAAGSSLLYTEQFYQLVKKRLEPEGVLQQWFPGGEKKILHAIASSLRNEFPHVRVFPSVEGWGFHFLASMSPLESATAEKIAGRMPVKAQSDLLEWHKNKNLHEYLNQVMNREVGIDQFLTNDGNIRITDDRPFNEYYLLRRLLAK